MLEADEEALEVVVAGFVDFAALDADVIDGELFVFHELVEVEAEGADVLGDFFDGLFEGHEDAGLVELCDAADEELDAHERLAAAGAGADEGAAAAGQAAARDFIQAADAAGGLGDG